MANRIVINTGAKVATLGDCVRIKPAQSYTDTIEKNKEYTNNTQKSVVFVNYCNQSFTVPNLTLFSNSDNGGNFTGKVSSFIIAPNQEIAVPIYYNGIYKSNTMVQNYDISFNGGTSMYHLNVTVPFVNTPPVTSDYSILLENRQNKTFTLNDFLAHYYDADGHPLSSITLVGDVSMFRLNGNTITSPANITAYQLENQMLTYIAQDTDAEVNVTVIFNATDSLGAISN